MTDQLLKLLTADLADAKKHLDQCREAGVINSGWGSELQGRIWGYETAIAHVKRLQPITYSERLLEAWRATEALAHEMCVLSAIAAEEGRAVREALAAGDGEIPVANAA